MEVAETVMMHSNQPLYQCCCRVGVGVPDRISVMHKKDFLWSKTFDMKCYNNHQSTPSMKEGAKTDCLSIRAS